MRPERETESSFMSDAECKDIDPNLFFPRFSIDEELAKIICRSCVVQNECLDFALQNRIDDGIWGGANEDERRRILKIRVSRGA